MPATGRLENAAADTEVARFRLHAVGSDAEAIGRAVRRPLTITAADAATYVNVLDEAGAHRILRQHFFRARRRAKGPIVLVNERVMYANTAAAALVQSDDRALLWEWGALAATRGDTRKSALHLTSGLPVAARAWPVEASGLMVGVLLRLDPQEPDQASDTKRGDLGKRRPDYGWPSLTGSERSVAAIIAEGATNREAAARLFLSRHTIDFHLRQIFRKLEINSRVELTRLVVLHSFAGHGHP